MKAKRQFRKCLRADLLFGMVVFLVSTVFFSSISISSVQGSDAGIGGRTSPGEEKSIELEIGPQPIKAMKLLLFRVQMQGYEEAEKILVDLSMPEMFMGINRFYLKRKGPGLYEGKRIIPTCPTGKTLWQAKVIIDHSVEKEMQFHVQK